MESNDSANPPPQPTGTAEGSKPAPHGHTHSFRSRVFARLRGWLLAGILVTAPLALTVWLIYWFVQTVDDLVNTALPLAYQPRTYLNTDIPGLGLVIAIVALMLIGATARGVIGSYFVHLGERILNRMPIVRGVYGALKQVFETVLSNQATAFREVVLVEFPRKNAWTIGFITGETIREVQNMAAAKVYNVFVPTTPNPTSGYLIFVSEPEIVRLSMSVEEGLKMVVSGGIVTPATAKAIQPARK
ncbi:MAG: DUF502 domain-containing protein [Alphaproteobacteria bacterium]